VLEAYCDESATIAGGEPLLVLVGYLADHTDWAAFSESWDREILKKYGLPHFHAKDLRSSNSKVYRYFDFSQRRELLATSCKVIGDHIGGGAVVYMRPSNWKRNTTPGQRSRWGSAYGVCMELLLGAFNEIVPGPQRVNVFLEDGHANADDAVNRIRNYKSDTEPMEYPELAGPGRVFDPEHPEMKSRETKMWIGETRLVPKSAMPTQTADLLAYLVGASLRQPIYPVFDGILDDLLPRKPHLLSGWDRGRSRTRA
jgi:hypothetical protein